MSSKDFSPLPLLEPVRRKGHAATRHIVVAISPEAAKQLSDTALAESVSIRVLVLRALAGIGIYVARRQLRQEKKIGDRLSGRERIKAQGYCVSVILPTRTFEDLKRQVAERRSTIVYVVRSALANARYPMGPDAQVHTAALVVDRLAGTHMVPTTAAL